MACMHAAYKVRCDRKICEQDFPLKKQINYPPNLLFVQTINGQCYTSSLCVNNGIEAAAPCLLYSPHETHDKIRVHWACGTYKY